MFACMAIRNENAMICVHFALENGNHNRLVSTGTEMHHIGKKSFQITSQTQITIETQSIRALFILWLYD